MILSAIGAVASLIGAGVNQAQANKKMKQAEDYNKLMEEINDNEYYQNKYLNSLDAPTTKGQLSVIRRNAEDANYARDNKNVAGNLTHEQLLHSKSMTNNTMANAVNSAVAAQEARQAQESERHIGREKELNYRDQNYKMQEANSRANNVDNYIKAGSELVNALGTSTPESTTPTATETTTPKAEGTNVFGLKPSAENLANTLNVGAESTPLVNQSSDKSFKWTISKDNFNPSKPNVGNVEEGDNGWKWVSDKGKNMGFKAYKNYVNNRNRGFKI